MLAILDLTEAANQPLVDSPSGCVLVYDGEVYNFRELREELKENGLRHFLSSGDTEGVLRCYLRWGPSFISKLRGMFAFAVYDPRVRQIFLARDHFGIKSLYVTEGPGRQVCVRERGAGIADAALGASFGGPIRADGVLGVRVSSRALLWCQAFDRFLRVTP